MESTKQVVAGDVEDDEQQETAEEAGAGEETGGHGDQQLVIVAGGEVHGPVPIIARLSAADVRRAEVQGGR